MGGTVHPADSFDAAADAKVLHKAMKGLGTNEGNIIDVLCHRSSSQRQEIVHAFKAAYGADLEDRLKSELAGNFERLMRKLITPLADYLAGEVHAAISGAGTDEKTLVEILCTRSNEEMKALTEAYEQKFGTSMESDVKGDTSGAFERLLVALLQADRESSSRVDMDKARDDAKELYEAGEGKMGTDESEFVSILGRRSNAHIRVLMEEYENLSGGSLKSAIKSEFSGMTKTALLAIMQCAKSRPKYFAKQLHKAMAGLGTKDAKLTRIVISRCEIDLADIKNAFEEEEGKSLHDAVASETSQNFKKGLLALIG